MFDTQEIKKAFDDFGKKVVKDARSNLAAKDKDVSGNLSRSLDYEFEGYKGGFRFVINIVFVFTFSFFFITGLYRNKIVDCFTIFYFFTGTKKFPRRFTGRFIFLQRYLVRYPTMYIFYFIHWKEQIPRTFTTRETEYIY